MTGLGSTRTSQASSQAPEKQKGINVSPAGIVHIGQSCEAENKFLPSETRCPLESETQLGPFVLAQREERRVSVAMTKVQYLLAAKSFPERGCWRRHAVPSPFVTTTASPRPPAAQESYFPFWRDLRY